ncbi:MAG TPA: hypothetical protein ENH11_10000, partial [Candidatus Acetothermia bacterium]|nr:hypothetical protein [Candidatus Acetothermia bacterium]
MQRFFTVVVVILFSMFAFAGPQVNAGQEGKLSPALREILAQTSDTVDLSSYASSMQVFSPNGLIVLPIAPGGGTADELGVLVKLAHPFFGTSFLGLPVMVSTGTILGMKVPL